MWIISISHVLNMNGIFPSKNQHTKHFTFLHVFFSLLIFSIVVVVV